MNLNGIQVAAVGAGIGHEVVYVVGKGGEAEAIGGIDYVEIEDYAGEQLMIIDNHGRPVVSHAEYARLQDELEKAENLMMDIRHELIDLYLAETDIFGNIEEFLYGGD